MNWLWTIKHRLSMHRNLPRKINIKEAAEENYGSHHRSGWNHAIYRAQVFQNSSGVYVDAFLDRKLTWGSRPGDAQNNPKPYDKPWIGFIHIPSEIPEWYFPEYRPQSFLKTPLWKECEKSCLGLICLSEKEKPLLKKMVSVPVENLYLPTETPKNTFSPEKFAANPEKTVLQIGYWLRKMHSIYFLNLKGLKRAIMPGMSQQAENSFKLEMSRFNFSVDKSSIPWWNHVKSADYDDLLSKNIVFIDLYDASANNVIVECIVRNTPVLVNRIPGVVNYLGEDYPFYFDTLEEASEKAGNDVLITKTHLYLKHSPIKQHISFDGFLHDFATSRLYQSLP